jgi:hypothetical protein
MLCINSNSFHLRHVFPIMIHNQCPNFELVSPECIGCDITWHIPPDQKVDANTMKSASFERNTTGKDFTCALIYKLQRKEYFEFDIDNTTNTSIQLVIICRVRNGYDSCLDVSLIERSNTMSWSEDKLKEFYYESYDINTYSHTIEDIWPLDDETVLITASKWEEWWHPIEVTLSEGTIEDDTIELLDISSDMEDE